MTLWSSTAHSLLWNLLEPSLWSIWKAQTEKCGLEGDQHPCPSIPDMQRNELGMEPEESYRMEEFFWAWGVCPGKLESWGICNLDQNQLLRPGVSPVDHSARRMCPYSAVHFGSTQCFLRADIGPASGWLLGLRVWQQCSHLAKLHISDFLTAIFKFHSLAVLKKVSFNWEVNWCPERLSDHPGSHGKSLIELRTRRQVFTSKLGLYYMVFEFLPD